MYFVDLILISLQALHIKIVIFYQSQPLTKYYLLSCDDTVIKLCLYIHKETKGNVLCGLPHAQSVWQLLYIYMRKTTKTITRTAVVGVPNYRFYGGGSDGGGSAVVGQNQSYRGNEVPVLVVV